MIKNLIKRITILTISLVFIILSQFFQSCSSSKLPDKATAEEYFTLALKEFNDDDLIEAQKLFDVIKIQFPASEYADDAQYYLGEVDRKSVV